MNHLAARPDIVVTAVDLDQTGVVANAVSVVVQAAVLCYDAVLTEVLDFGVNHLAVLGKLIAPLPHQTIGLGDPVVATVNHLAARPDIVVAAVDLDQTGVVANAVPVIVQAAVLCYDAVLSGILNLRVSHPAVVVKSIAPLTHQTVGLGDPVATAVNHLAARPDIVVAAVDLDQTGVVANAVLVVVQTVVLCNDTVLELSVCIKAICTLREAAVAHPPAVAGLVNNQRAVCLGVIVVAVKPEHTHVSTDAINVVVLDAAFLDNAVLELLIMENYAVFIEVVPPLRKQAVGLFRRNPEITISLRQHILHCLIICVEVVIQVVTVCVLNLHKSGERHVLTVFYPIGILALNAQTILADFIKPGGIGRSLRHRNKFLVPAGKLVTIARSFGFIGRAFERRHLPLFVDLCDGHAVHNPGNHSTGFGNDNAFLQQHVAN